MLFCVRANTGHRQGPVEVHGGTSDAVQGYSRAILKGDGESLHENS